MFSKEWLEHCSQSITSYETPAKGEEKKPFRPGHEKPKDDEVEEVVEKKKIASKMDIKKYLISMKKRRGE